MQNVEIIGFKGYFKIFGYKLMMYFKEIDKVVVINITEYLYNYINFRICM